MYLLYKNKDFGRKLKQNRQTTEQKTIKQQT